MHSETDCKVLVVEDDAGICKFLKTTLTAMQKLNPDFISVTFGAGGSAGGVSTVEVADFYAHTERIAGRIQFCSDKIIARETRREQFRRQMLEIAKNTKHKRGISDKYVPPKRRNFR